MSYQYKTMVYIGRFQPVHRAHLETIHKAINLGEKLIIAVGSHKRPKTIKNPWTAEERIELMKKSISNYLNMDMKILDKRISFIKVRDHVYNNNTWATELYSKAIASGATQNADTCLIGCMKDDSSFYLKMFPQWDLHSVPVVKSDNNILSATSIRDEMFEQKYLNPKDANVPGPVYETITEWINSPEGTELKKEYQFLQNYKKLWESAPFPPVFVTTDTIVIKSNHILMIKRKCNPGKGLYALPGGFVDQNETIRQSALRELKEETRIKVDKIILDRNIKDIEVFDHPNRSDRGRTITHAFVIDLGEGPLPEVKGGDDASGAQWVSFLDLNEIEDQTYEDHFHIINKMVSKY
jgi:bifunctional NMN adenylyltransferase/nudix hydrolase